MWYLGCTQVDNYKTNQVIYQSTITTYGTFGVAFKRDIIEKNYISYKKGLLNNDNFWAKSIEKKGIIVSNPKIIGHRYGFSENAQYEINEDTKSYFKYNDNIYI
jgi:hypothetical protein